MLRSSSTSNFGAASRWSLHNLSQSRFNALPMPGTVHSFRSCLTSPGMNGLELIPKAKALRPDVPIVMITAYGDAETKRKALENGAEALLNNPIDFGTLRSEIDSRVERAA